MPRAKTPSFICELPLQVTPADERHLLVRLDCARQVYNACLGESLKRLERMRPSPDYQAARAMPKSKKKSPAAVARAAAFKAVNEQFGFQEFDLHAYAVQFSHSWLGEHLDSNTVQKVATRAFQAAQQHAFGKRGQPRFKGKGQFDSVEGKTNASGILWRENAVKWTGLELPAMIDAHDAVIAHGLASRVKFARLVRRKLNGRNRFYVQLVCEGKSYRKPTHAIGKGVVGLDIGPSTVAIVSPTGDIAKLERFCDALKPHHKAIRKLQRRMDRQRRANNPDNFSANGTAKKGAHRWHKSNHYLQTRSKLAELRRQQAAYRKSLHGQLVNRVLAQGNVIKLEKLSYRAFQKQYGKSVGFRGPGTFVSHLRRKAENAGVEIVEFPTVTTRLSQTCVCGQVVKKPLALRWHVCDCGVGPVQRDLFSAWLACFVNDDKRLDAGQAQAAWPGVDTRLRTASSQIPPTMGQGQPKPNLHLATRAGQSRSSVQLGWQVSKAGHGDSCAVTRELASQPEPPAFRRGE